jgi:Leucine-rich repeat (LRR) protein
MPEAKKCRRTVPTGFDALPDDLFYHMVTFLGDSMNQIKSYTQVSRTFRRAIHSATMLSRLRWDVPNPLRIHCIPHMLLKKVHNLRIKSSGTLNDLHYVPELRTLDVSSFASRLKDEHMTGVRDLSFLHTINLSGNRYLTNLDELLSLKSLRHLMASNCVGLTRIPCMPGLQTLTIEGCNKVRNLEVLAQMPNLEKLSIQNQPITKELLDLLPVGLRDLGVRFAHDLRDAHLHSLARLTNLTHLNLSGSGLESFKNLAPLKQLEELRVPFCKALHDLEGLSALKSLRFFYAYYSPLGSAVSLEGLVSLEELEFASSELTTISFPCPLPKLHTMRLHSCPLLQHLTEVHNAFALRKLDLSGNGSVDNALLGKLQTLSNLKDLNLTGCLQVTFIGLALLPKSLERLILQDCTHVCNVAMECLSSLLELKRLDLQGCTLISDEGLHELSAIKSVQYLNLSFCTSITDVGMFALSKLVHLRVLRLHSCHKITDLGLRALANLTELQSLDFTRCKKLDTLRPLRALTSLRYINLSGCVKLTDNSLRNLLPCINLETIDTTFCKRVSKGFNIKHQIEIARSKLGL